MQPSDSAALAKSVSLRTYRHALVGMANRFFDFIFAKMECLVLSLGVLLRFTWWIKPEHNLDVDLLRAAISEKSFSGLLTDSLSYCQSAPIGFLVFAKAWGRVPWNGDRWLALPLFLVSIGTLFIWRKVLQNVDLTRKTYLLGLFLFAFHPCCVAYASFLKPYMLDVLFSTVFLLFLLKRKITRRTVFCLSAIVFVSPFFSTGSFFIIVPVFLIFYRNLLLDTPSKNLRGRVLASISRITPVAASCVAGYGLNLCFLLQTMPQGMFDYWNEDFAVSPFSTDGAVWYWIRIVRIFRGPVYFTWLSYFPSLLQILLFAIPAICFATGFFQTRKDRTVSGLMSLGSILFVVLASGLGKWPLRCGTVYAGRLLMFLIPSISLCCIIGLDRMFTDQPLLFLPFCIFVAVSVIQPLGLRDKLRSTWSPSRLQSFIETAPSNSEIHLDGVAEAFFRVNGTFPVGSYIRHDDDRNNPDGDPESVRDFQFPSVFVYGRSFLHKGEIATIKENCEQSRCRIRDKSFGNFLVMICDANDGNSWSGGSSR